MQVFFIHLYIINGGLEEATSAHVGGRMPAKVISLKNAGVYKLRPSRTSK